MACVIFRKGSKCWVGRYRHEGKEYKKSLGVEIADRDQFEEGVETDAFQRSKVSAEKKLDKLLADLKSDKSTEQIAHAVFQARTRGRKIKTYHIKDLSSEWKRFKRSKPLSVKYENQCIGWIDLFSFFMGKKFPDAVTMDHVGEEHAEAFMEQEEARGIAPKTYNDILKVLRTVTRRTGNSIFADIPLKELQTINRIPYEPEEIRAILDAAQADDFIYPIIVTALCSAMRLGDCCCLLWSAVDMQAEFLSVKTAKTGATTDIPIFPLLKEVLVGQLGNGSQYVFPLQKEQYKKDQTMFTRRLRSVLAKAGFYDTEKVPAINVVDQYDPKDLFRKAERYIASVPTRNKRERMPLVLTRYLDGESVPSICVSMDIGKGTVSSYLNEIQKGIGIRFIRGKRDAEVLRSQVPNRGQIHEVRANGMKKASVRDWHSFRTTWITLALTSGISMEIVQTITGHATVEVVCRNYFKPKRSQLRKVLQANMPALLVDGMVDQSEHVLDLLHSMDIGNWDAVRKEVIEILSVGR